MKISESKKIAFNAIIHLISNTLFICKIKIIYIFASASGTIRFFFLNFKFVLFFIGNILPIREIKIISCSGVAQW